MALPKLLQKLFDDEGKGPKLKPSIIPTKINGQEPDETGEFNLQLSDPDAATRPEILTAVKKVTEASEVTFEPDESLPPVGHNIGEEWVSYTGVIPFGGIPYCGQEVTRETYRDLWEYAQTQGLVKSESEWQSIYSAQGGNVPFYSSGDGSSTFRMPRLVGYVRGASYQSEAGEYVAEGLPNIEGSLTPQTIGFKSAHVSSNGCVVVGGSMKGTVSTTTATGYQVSINASASNPIYGNSSHVTPETSIVLFGVYAFGEITNQGALDATTLATSLARVESNLNGVVRSVNGLTADPSGNVAFSLGFGIDTSSVVTRTSGTTYTASRDCFIVANSSSSAGYTYINGVEILKTYDSCMCMLVRKGDTYKMVGGSPREFGLK